MHQARDTWTASPGRPDTLRGRFVLRPEERPTQASHWNQPCANRSAAISMCWWSCGFWRSPSDGPWWRSLGPQTRRIGPRPRRADARLSGRCRRRGFAHPAKNHLGCRRVADAAGVDRDVVLVRIAPIAAIQLSDVGRPVRVGFVHLPPRLGLGQAQPLHQPADPDILWRSEEGPKRARTIAQHEACPTPNHDHVAALSDLANDLLCEVEDLLAGIE